MKYATSAVQFSPQHYYWVYPLLLGIHFLLGHVKWPPLPDCIQFGSPLVESNFIKYATSAAQFSPQHLCLECNHVHHVSGQNDWHLLQWHHTWENVDPHAQLKIINMTSFFIQAHQVSLYHRLWLIAHVSPWKRRLLTQKQRVWLHGTASTIELSGKTLHAPNTPHAKLVKILNVSHWIFEQLLYQNEPHLL